MKKKLIYLIIFVLFAKSLFGQVPHDINVASNNSAERVARFKVQDQARDFFEITNATQYSNSFIPILWGHQESDNRYDLALFATTKSQFDNGSIPLMKFRVELRNAINLNAPSGGTFPWGTVKSNVVNRPAFAWENGNTQLMTLRANGNLGLGTTNPQEKLHINGSIRGNGISGALMIRTSSGFITIGPQNTNWAHINTDREKFFFNKPIYNYVGKFSSYNNSHLFLQTNGIDRVFINRWNGYVGIGTNSPIAKLDINGALRIRTISNNLTDDFVITSDGQGYIHKRLISSIGGGGNNCGNNNYVLKNFNGNTNCSQIFDNGSRVGIGTSSPAYRLSVNGAIHSMSNLFISDRKFKKNIKNINGALETILKLEGKKYNWKVDEFKNEYHFTNKKQIGFIAQEVEKILPEVVYKDKRGNYSMNYNAIIPVLVEAIKEQQNQIVILKNLVEINKPNFSDSVSENKTSFSSNYPNPFSITTTVEYFIEPSIKKAILVIYDNNGATISKFILKERNEKSQITINKSSLNTGLYFYTLLADDVVIGTKKMIVK